jgi:hypothetical protein
MRLQDRGWYTGQLPAIMDEFRELRNEAVQSAPTDRNLASRLRNRLLGVGFEASS